MASHFQTYESLRMVIHEALGGTENSTPAVDEDKAIQSFDELVKAFQAVGGTVG